MSCVTTAQVHHEGGYALDTRYILLVGKGNSFKLLKGDNALSISILLHYKIIQHPTVAGTYKIKTSAYYYTINDANGKELLAYHWHPTETPDIPYPHLHIGDPKLKKFHLPTGRVSLEQVLRLLIRDFKVKPKKANWEAILNETQDLFETYRSWH